MILDIKPLQNTVDCIEDAVLSVLTWYNYDYLLMYSHAWSFALHEDKVSDSTSLGRRLDIRKSYQYDLLEKFHGVKITLDDVKENVNIKSAINDELVKFKPVIILFDMYWAPWSEDYQTNKDSLHAFIITGIDENKENYVCTDTLYLKQGLLLPVNLLEIGTVRLYIFDSVEENKEFTLKSILEAMIAKIQADDFFKDIKKFGTMFLTSFDNKKEMEGFSDLTEVPLQENLFKILHNRKKIMELLSYLYEIYNEKYLLTISEHFKQIVSKWEVIRVMILKLLLTYEYQDEAKNGQVVMEISDKIIAVADVEQEAFCAFKAAAQIGANEETSVEMNDKRTIEAGENKGVLHLDLSRYYNNKGIEIDLNDTGTANLCGTGQFFVMNDYALRDKLWKVENMEFLFPDLTNAVYDNISCKNQEIDIEEGHYNKIMILGCAEWGNFSERMTLKYADSSERKELLEFTDWDSEAFFNETIAWTGRGAKRDDTSMKYLDFDVHLFAFEQHISSEGKLSKIVLPDCPYIHIFAVSLGFA